MELKRDLLGLPARVDSACLCMMPWTEHNFFDQSDGRTFCKTNITILFVHFIENYFFEIFEFSFNIQMMCKWMKTDLLTYFFTWFMDILIRPLHCYVIVVMVEV